jgi:hypothetical protein
VVNFGRCFPLKPGQFCTLIYSFPFDRQPGVNAAQIKGLAGLGFIVSPWEG